MRGLAYFRCHGAKVSTGALDIRIGTGGAMGSMKTIHGEVILGLNVTNALTVQLLRHIVMEVMEFVNKPTVSDRLESPMIANCPLVAGIGPKNSIEC
jgi:hypothetical protein